MFFVLSKILNVFTKPLVLLGLLAWAAWRIRNPTWKARARYLLLGLLFLFTNDFLTNEILRAWEIAPPAFASLQKPYTYGILLTGVTRYDTSPDDRVHFHKGADRVLHTVELYKRGIIRKIMVSGGTGRLSGAHRKEADELAYVLQLAGVPAEDILIENESRNTHESAVLARSLLGDAYAQERCLLITSAFHMRRSLGCFRKQGWQVDPFSADVRSHDRLFHLDVLLIPNIEALSHWQTLLKEWVGMVAYRVAGYL